MTQAMNPCPFCGGEAVVCEYTDESMVYVKCSACGAMSGTVQATYEKADENWNRRAERTCHIDMPVIDWETGETDYRCSACGFSADPQDWAETYDYCPRCGAKVVDE